MDDDNRGNKAKLTKKLDDTKLSHRLEALSLTTRDRRAEASPDVPASTVVDRTDSGVASPIGNGVGASDDNPGNSQAGPDPSRTPRNSSLSLEPPSASSGSPVGVFENHHSRSDSGQGSEADETTTLQYHFFIPNHLCGKLIGAKGAHVKHLKSQTQCKIDLRDPNGARTQSNNKNDRPDEMQICVIQGTRSGIDKCLDLINQKFPELNLEQTNGVEETAYYGDAATSPQVALAEGISVPVVVAAIVSGGHLFLQQPYHPTFEALPRLEGCMNHVYEEMSTPLVGQPPEIGLVCVAKYEGKWYRVHVVTFDCSNNTCDVKFLDVGGYAAVSVADLRKIRSDFLTLPFQTIECYLANVIPIDGLQWCSGSSIVLNELVSNKVCRAEMIGYAEDMTPLVKLYSNISDDGEPALVNRELVERCVAGWVEIVPKEQLISGAQCEASALTTEVPAFQPTTVNPNL